MLYVFISSFFLLRRHIEVHGRPTPAVFRNKPHQGGKNSFRLVWTVDSYSRIEEYRLLYRQIKAFHPVSRSESKEKFGEKEKKVELDSGRAKG